MFTIQEIFYDRTAKAGPAVTGSISVLRNIPYLVGIEVVRTDTDNEHEHIDISIDGKNFGRCNPLLELFESISFSLERKKLSISLFIIKSDYYHLNF